MSTCGELLDEISAQLHGYGSTSDRVTPLTSSMSPSDTTFQVDYAFGQSVGITPGVVEIDSELLYVTAINAETTSVTLANGFGRGYKGTTATAHTAGTAVVSRPKFPRHWLLKKLNEVIDAIYPELFAVNTYTSTVKTPSDTYVLPGTNGTPLGVLDVQWQEPIGNWQRAFSYDLDPYDGTFRLGGGCMVGQPLRVIYKTAPRQFAAESDDLVTATGLPSSASDVLTLGVIANVVPTLDISRAQVSSVEQSDRSRVVPPYAGVNASKYFMALYQQRLAAEAAGLRRQYRARITRKF